MRVNSKRGKVPRAAPFSPCEKGEWKGGNEVARRRSRRLRFVKECLRVVIRSVCKNFVDMRRAVAYIRYHIVFRACLRACGSLRVLRVLWKHPGKTASA